ncbi:serine/threonine-protein kinase MRCK alpha-like [Callorhinchus milii]|uniref:serine/threonine-protein kinase MRCK alpha-like n=1 Tax=Callorhinchus milii TaxID=7868 RepID=UPI001C3F7D4F|nr:serine/threonine-protein kinase MRCK alpha-like [Callorhinchus milii]
MAPETLLALEDGTQTYGAECDWWALGVCAYEMLFGETPFYSESLSATYSNIIHHREHFRFPDKMTGVTGKARDLIRGLLCEREERLGREGLADFERQDFFQGVPWGNMADCLPPFIPHITHPTDTSNFEVEDESLTFSENSHPPFPGPFQGIHLPFAGYTFSSLRHSQTTQEMKGTHAGDIELGSDTQTVFRSVPGASEEEMLKLRKEMEEMKMRTNLSPTPFDPQDLPLPLELDNVWGTDCAFSETVSSSPVVMPILRHLILFAGVLKPRRAMKGFRLLWLAGTRSSMTS